MVKRIKNVTKPLMPVVEMLQGEVPIISDLEKLVGEGPVTVLDVLEAVSGNDLSLLRSILQFVRFVNTLPSDGALLIPLGNAPRRRFTVNNDARAGRSRCPTRRATASPGRRRADEPDRRLSSSSDSARATPADECDRPRLHLRRLRPHLPVPRRRRARSSAS